MMRAALFFVFIASLFAARAELSVASFEVRPMDLTARLHPEYDRNGNLCALIKVELPVEGCKFEGNVLGSHYDVNEYWVYMSGGSKMLNIKCPGEFNLMVNFGDVSDIASLEGGVTYGLRLLGFAQPGSAPSASGKATLSVETATPGASITINGQPKGNDSWSGQLSPGDYTIEAYKDGYMPHSVAITLSENESLRLTIPALTVISSEREPRNLDLCAMLDGVPHFFSESEWKALPANEQDKYDKIGIVVIDRKERFILSLESESMTWHGAVRKYGENSLPSEAQCRIMTKLYDVINPAIEAFGGNTYSNFYWGQSYDSLNAWCYGMTEKTHGYVQPASKDVRVCVRTVAPIPR